MAPTFEEVVASRTVVQAYPLPGRPLSREDARAILETGVQLAQQWLGEDGGPPFFAPENPRSPTSVELFLQQKAEDFLGRNRVILAKIRARQHPQEGERPPLWPVLSPIEEAALLAIWTKTSTQFTHGHPSMPLLFGTAGEQMAFAFVDKVTRGMARAARHMQSVNVGLYLGWRDWKLPTTTLWERAKTLLAAREYQQLVEHHPGSRPVSSAGPDSTSNSLAHFTNLTARQARRNGVDEEQLRRTWA